MPTQWRFDPDNPYQDGYEESFLQHLHSTEVWGVVTRKLVAIQDDPKTAYRDVVKGRVVYFALTGPVLSYGDITIESLLIVYTLEERKKLIQRVLVCKASEYVTEPDRATFEVIAVALRDAIARALANTGAKKGN